MEPSDLYLMLMPLSKPLKAWFNMELKIKLNRTEAKTQPCLMGAEVSPQDQSFHRGRDVWCE